MVFCTSSTLFERLLFLASFSCSSSSASMSQTRLNARWRSGKVTLETLVKPLRKSSDRLVSKARAGEMIKLKCHGSRVYVASGLEKGEACHVVERSHEVRSRNAKVKENRPGPTPSEYRVSAALLSRDVGVRRASLGDPG